jgi:hypothetical protein
MSSKIFIETHKLSFLVLTKPILNKRHKKSEISEQDLADRWG